MDQRPFRSDDIPGLRQDLGIVVEQAEKSLLTPRVKVFFSTKSDTRIAPEVIDLSRPGGKEKIVGREDSAQWNFPYLDELWSGLPAAH